MPVIEYLAAAGLGLELSVSWGWFGRCSCAVLGFRPAPVGSSQEAHKGLQLPTAPFSFPLCLQTLAWALNFGACFGGNGTLIGASANIVTATLAERAGEKITFVQWLRPGLSVMVVSLAMADVWMILRFCL